MVKSKNENIVQPRMASSTIPKLLTGPLCLQASLLLLIFIFTIIQRLFFCLVLYTELIKHAICLDEDKITLLFFE